ncbi:hypothetical protein P7C71_g5606, partial [Lecanoromycetidae sp. Uapishka_2]
MSRTKFVDPLTRKNQCAFYANPGPSVDYLVAEDFHVQSQAQKRNIFKDHQLIYEAQCRRGTAILECLRSLAPDIAMHFELKANPVEKMNLRLWAQRETPEMREDSYVALSYCWNPAAYPARFRIEDETYPLPIPPLMFSGLAAERGARTTGVWVDQLCIDQSNKAEKAVSVGAMDAVYKCADWVVVALLDVEVHLAQQAFLRGFIRDYENASKENGETPFRGEDPPYMEKNPVFKRFFYTICESRWFTRAWCAHEMELGENHLFYVPCQSRKEGGEVDTMFSFTATFLWDMLLLSAEIPSQVETAHTLRDRLTKIFDMRRRINEARQRLTGEGAPDERQMLSYTAEIRETFELGAGGDPDLPPDQRAASANLDKMSIVLNVLGCGLGVKRFPGQILTEDEAFRRMMILSLSAGDSTALCTLGPYYKFMEKSSPLSWWRRPTWTDLGSGTQRRDHLPRMAEPLTRRIQIDQSPELGWIQLDVVALGAPRPPSERYRDLATNLTEACIKLGLGRAPPGPFGDAGAEYVGKDDLVSKVMAMTINAASEWANGPLYQYWQSETFFGTWRERFNWTLACLLECGIDWMLGMAKRCGFPYTGVIGAKIRSFLPSNEHILELEKSNWADVAKGREAVNAILSLANWALNWGVNRPHGRSSSYMPALYTTGLKGTAMIYTLGDALLQVVIPSALFPDAYRRLFRVWLLQAKGDPFYDKMRSGQSAEWFLRSKVIIFTDVKAKDMIIERGSAADGRPGWRLREEVKVFGPPPEFQVEDVVGGKGGKE